MAEPPSASPGACETENPRLTHRLKSSRWVTTTALTRWVTIRLVFGPGIVGSGGGTTEQAWTKHPASKTPIKRPIFSIQTQ